MFSKEFAVKKNVYNGSLMVNICDKELLDLVLKEDKLTIKIDKEYFGDLFIDENEVIKLLQECSIANLVGENVIRTALKLKLASEDSIRRIDKIPFLMIFKFINTY